LPCSVEEAVHLNERIIAHALSERIETSNLACPRQLSYVVAD
jgi:hypothetical protein